MDPSEQKMLTVDESLCPECGFSFSTEENMLIHLKNIHSKIPFYDLSESQDSFDETVMSPH